MDERKETDMTNNDQSNIGNNNIGATPAGQQNVYTVGSGADGNTSSGHATYTPPTGNDYRSGEYSYSPRERVPDYRYTYSQPSTPPPPPESKPPKKKNSGKVGVIALLIAAVILLMALVGIGGVMLGRSFYEDDPGTPAGNGVVNNGSDTTLGSADASTVPGSNEAIIIKNNDSVTVKTTGGNIGDETLTIPDVVALVKNSVVEIYTEIPTYNGRFVESGAGSGVIISKVSDNKTYYVVSNNHVISGAQKITVRLTDGTTYTAKLCGTDSNTDVAVLSIESETELTVASLGSSAGLVVGEGVIAIGNPLGELGGTVTNGIVSALAREVEIDGQSMTLLQTNAAVNPGNSGGGLFNMKGELIGVVNAKSGGDNVENIGFAIPIDTAYDVVTELINHGYVTGRIDAGLSLIDVTDTYTAWYYGVNSLGVYVYESKYSDDIKSGDRLVSVNGTEVSTAADVKSALGECKVGDVVTVRISRNGKQSDVELTLHEYVPTLTNEQK